MGVSPGETFSAFADAINEHNIEKIVALMSDDHTFLDAHGNGMNKQQMEMGWSGYFNWFPDYSIEITEIFTDNDTVAAFGFAGGTFNGTKQPSKDTQWRLPAFWKAIIADEKIKTWQVFADTKIPFDIISKNTRRSL